jgi:hypothetical protein
VHRLGGFVLAVACVAACAQVLSYDDYRERPAKVVDTGVAVADVSDAQEAAPDVVDSGPPPWRVPLRPAGERKASGGKTIWLAVRTYHLGIFDPAGGPADDAWKQWGYDLDEVCTGPRESTENTGTCIRPMTANQDSLIDGLRCRDNNFGRHIGGMVRTAMPDAEDSLNKAVDNGTSTWIFRIDDIDPTGSDPFAPAALYRSADERMTNPPKWDGSDARAVLSDSVTDKDVMKPVLTFPNAYIAGNTWVSGEPATMRLGLPIARDIIISMNLQSAVFSLELNDKRDSGRNGTAAGALAVADIEPILFPIAEAAGFCPGSSLYDAVLKTAAKAPDVVLGAPKLQSLGVTCNGISVGVGFEVMPVKPSTAVVDPLPPRTGACGDAG